MHFPNFSRGQGATEYLVLLAVVLIIALVAIALLGFFPGLSTDAQITQSQAYWSGEATPFGVSEFTHTKAGSLGLCTGGAPTHLYELIIENKGTGAYTINTINITIDSTPYFSSLGGDEIAYLCNADRTVIYGVPGSGDYDAGSQNGPFVLAPGEKVHTYIDSSLVTIKCQEGIYSGGILTGYVTKTVEADINISYTTENGLNTTQYGGKKYIFKCSKA